MHKKLIFHFFVLIVSFSSLKPMQTQSFIDRAPEFTLSTAERITLGREYMARARMTNKTEDEKKSLIKEAANEYEWVYRDQRPGDYFHSIARLNLDGIYLRYPDLKLRRTLQLFAEEDKKLIIPEKNIEQVPEERKEDTSERRIDAYLKVSSNRTKHTKRVFGRSIAISKEEKEAKEEAREKEAAEKTRKERIAKERTAQKALAKEKAAKSAAKKEKDTIPFDEILLQSAAEQMKKREFSESAHTYWQVLETSKNAAIKKKAREQIQALHDSKKSNEATYYTVLLHQDNPEKMIDLFLQAENQRDIKKEQKNITPSRKESALSKTKDTQENVFLFSPAMMKAQKEIHALAQKGNLRALHALTIYHYHQAAVNPLNQISALRSSAACAKQLHDAKKSFSDGYAYSVVLNDLGVALFERAKQKLELKKNSSITQISGMQDINEAECLLQNSSDLGQISSTCNLAILHEFRFKNLHEVNKLDDAITSYVSALEKGSSQAASHIESLLIEGIDNYPLNLAQRSTLQRVLKEHNPESALFTKNVFKESPYYTAAQKIKVNGSMEFYEGLFLFDRKDAQQAVQLIGAAGHENYSPANSFLANMALFEALMSGNVKNTLQELEEDWALIPSLPFPSGPLLLSSTRYALTTLIDQGEVDAMYTDMCGHMGYFLPYDQNSIKRVCDLLNKSETILAQNVTHSAQSKLYDTNFISNLLNFSRQAQSPAPLHAAANHALARLQRSTTDAQTLGALKLLSAITESLDVDLRKQNRSYVPCPQSSANLIAKIEQILNSHPEKEYFTSLKALRSVLQGIPQASEKKTDTLVFRPQNMRELSASLTELYKLQTKRAGQGMMVGNDTEIVTSLRSLIAQFRLHKMREKYQALRSQVDIMTNLAAYTAAKDKFKDGTDLLSVMGINLVLIADKSLIEPNYPLEKALERFCSVFPMGSAILAREFILNELFAPNKAIAQAYLKRAQEECVKAGEKLEEKPFLAKIEKEINESQLG